MSDSLREVSRYCKKCHGYFNHIEYMRSVSCVSCGEITKHTDYIPEIQRKLDIAVAALTAIAGVGGVCSVEDGRDLKGCPVCMAEDALEKLGITQC